MKTQKKSISVKGIRVLEFNFDQDSGWIRILGRGIKWKDIRVYPLLFSERTHFSSGIKIRNYYIGWLPLLNL